MKEGGDNQGTCAGAQVGVADHQVVGVEEEREPVALTQPPQVAPLHLRCGVKEGGEAARVQLRVRGEGEPQRAGHHVARMRRRRGSGGSGGSGGGGGSGDGGGGRCGVGRRRRKGEAAAVEDASPAAAPPARLMQEELTRLQLVARATTTELLQVDRAV